MVFVTSNVKKVYKNSFSFDVIDDKIFHQPVGYDFWGQYSSWETNTFNIFDKFLKKDKCFLDIGAWVGATSIYAAQLCDKIYCIEPDPVAFNFLQQNLTLNNITNAKMYNNALAYERGVFLSEVDFFGSSMSRCSHDSGSLLVSGLKLEDIIFDEKFSLIKMDIEGYESVCLPNMVSTLREIKVPIYISFHQSFFPNKEKSVQELINLLNFYEHIVDDSFCEIDYNNLNGFGSYLFF